MSIRDNASAFDSAEDSARRPEKALHQSSQSVRSIDDLCINAIRTLSMDAVQRANSGHPNISFTRYFPSLSGRNDFVHAEFCAWSS
jgi:hypothetical protein